MPYYGDIAPSDTIDTKFCTVNTSGVPTVLAGTPAISVYKDNSITQSTAGVTLTVDFDGVVGLNNLRITTSSDGTFYSAGSNFQIVITTGTVGGNSVVGYVVGEFSINFRTALRPTTAGRTLDVTATGGAGVDWANVESQATAVNLSATTVNLVNTATALTTNNDKTGYALSAAGVDALWDEDIVAAHGTADTAGRALRTLDTISDRTNNANLNSLLGVADTAGADVPSQVTDEVWDEARAGHVAAGSFGEGAASVQGNVTGSVASVTGGVGSVTGAVGSVTGAVGSVTGSIGSLAAQAQADVNTQVLDVLNTDTFAEAAQQAPPSTTTLVTKIGYLYKFMRNRVTSSTTEIRVYNDDAITIAHKAAHSDDGTTYDRGEFTTGP